MTATQTTPSQTAIARTAIDDRRPSRAVSQRRHRWATTSLAAALTIAVVGFAAQPASAVAQSNTATQIGIPQDTIGATLEVVTEFGIVTDDSMILQARRSATRLVRAG